MTFEVLAERLETLRAEMLGHWALDVERVEGIRRMAEERFDSMQRAILKAETASEKRFESINEFRAALADQQHTLMPRSEYQVQHKALEARITAAIKSIEASLEVFRLSAAQEVGRKAVVTGAQARVWAIGAAIFMLLIATGVGFLVRR